MPYTTYLLDLNYNGSEYISTKRSRLTNLENRLSVVRGNMSGGLGLEDANISYRMDEQKSPIAQGIMFNNLL